MKILIIGSGGREHSIAWKISQSPSVKKIFCIPGNAGISEVAECITISDIKDFAIQQKIDLTVVGPEQPLVEGIVDEFEKANLKIFGPNKVAAKLESSKIFAKNFMKRYNIPTADFEVFDNFETAKKFIENHNDYSPSFSVVKADGLAGGKGAFVCDSKKMIIETLENLMVKKILKTAGEKVIIEKKLEGEEFSIIGFCDGKNIFPLPPSQDHKRAYDNDTGPNTGGMGAYAPAKKIYPFLNDVKEKIFKNFIYGLHKENINYKGVIYFGLMLTKNEPYVLEFNVRFGDPETQAILPLIKNDFSEIILKTIDGNLKETDIIISAESVCCVVVASGGYPDDYQKGKIIYGLDKLSNKKDLIVFHAGTKKEENNILTNGGRVLNIVGIGKNLKSAIQIVYDNINEVYFENMHFRKDIAKKALTR